MRDCFLLLIICAFFFFWKLAAFGLIGADEPRYAQVAREMLDRHDWITPTLGGAAWLEKPPLYYWQAMVAYRLFGVSDWAARLPSALDAFALVIAVYLFFRRFRPAIELDAALATATMAGIVGYARAASMDMPLAATFGVALLAWLAWFESGERKFLLSFYFFLALGMLAKGPVAPFLAVVIVAVFASWQKQWRLFASSVSLAGVTLFLAVALPWYVAVQLRNRQFFRVFILEHNLARFGTNLYHHPEPFWYYIPVTLIAWVPWVALVVTAIITVIRKWRASDPLHQFAAIWLVVVVAFFSISRSKLPGYVLPGVPAGVLLLTDWLRHRTPAKKAVFVALAHGAVTVALIFFALMLRIILLQPGALWSSAALVPAIAAASLGLLVLMVLIVNTPGVLRVAALVPAILVVAITLRSGADALNHKLSARYISDLLSQYDRNHLPTAVYLVPRETEFGLAFYRNHVMPSYDHGQVPDSPHFVVAAQGYPQGVARVAGRRVTFLRNVPEQRLDLYFVPAK